MNPGSTILITGGTGLLGNALTDALLQRGFSVIILTRNPGEQKSNHPQLFYAGWNVPEKIIDKDALTKADYIIHLAGASLAEKRWTKKRKQEIISSRVDSGRLISESLKYKPNKVKGVISASAIGYYGSDSLIPGGLQKFEESDPVANNFLGNTCRQWEAAIDSVSDLDKRLVKLRIGIVLSNEGGALKEFKRPIKFGIATILGSGNQVISWIHIDDLLRIFLFMLDNENISGTFNAVAPNPVTNKELILQIAEMERGKNFIPVHVPAFILKLVLGEISNEVLNSSTVSAEKISKTGFIFQYPTIDTAIRQLAGS
jgi:uncharacterized protein